ncbi:AT-hook motif nuclear-localized protein 10 isoform X2 [Impatiens glandulifera]|nr:AT-hook motif nuclear-localized protein 10 isoform X2 [Impatiens glandulifera]
MSGSETGGVVTNSSPFSIGFQKSPLVVSSEQQQQPVVHNMHFAYAGGDGSAAFKPASGGSPHFQSPAAAVPYDPNMMGQPAKKKRGRPRRYGPDGSMSLGLSPAGSGGSMSQSGGSFAPTSQSPASLHSLKKVRGRPLGSSKKQQLQALGSAGFGFLPHVITVNVGEDVSSKIMSFSQNGPRAVCVLSANGSISNVTLRQAATSGGTATYEGRFEILSLSGSFLLTEIGGQRSRTGGLSVSLAGPDGRVLGGSVAGLLTAASPVQVIVGSFIADGGDQKKSKTMNEREPASAQANVGSIGGGGVGGGSTGGSSSPSHGTASESSGGGPVSPLPPMNNNNNQCNNNSNPPPPQQQPPPFPMMPWR